MTDPARVCFDSDMFVIQGRGGISRYFSELAWHIDRMPDWRARICAPVHWNHHLRERSGVVRGCYIPRPPLPVGSVYRSLNRLASGPLMRMESPAVLHRTFYRHRPRHRGAALVITIHDMIHEKFPHLVTDSGAVADAKAASIREADHIICVSQSTARDLQELVSVPDEKITVVHHGCTPVQKALVESHRDVVAGGSIATGRPFLLYVGHRGGYKNFDLLLQAYAASDQLRSEFDLVAFGGGDFTAAELESFDRLGVSRAHVHHLHGGDEMLNACYARAHLMVYPSLHEGFGMPLLEAMAMDCPVVCSDAGPMPEVAADAARYCSATDAESLRDAMEQICFDAEARSELISRGRARQRQFTWQACADGTTAVYRRLL